MERERGRVGGRSSDDVALDGGLAPGKRTLTDQLGKVPEGGTTVPGQVTLASTLPIARKKKPGANPSVTPEALQAIVARAATGGGSALPATLARKFASLGLDLSNVRVHTDSAAADAADELGANAFASGDQIFFAAGQYNPGSPAGDRLIAHELAHVAQHAAGELGGTARLTDPSDSVESAADATADAMLAGTPSPNASAASTKGGSALVRTKWLMENDAAPVQRKAAGEAAAPDPTGLATAGVQSANERMPHHDQIQASFGKHEISGVRAQTGGGAAEASRGLGASAYVVGDRVGFAQSPDLHTAAHEAAHVVQQQAGVQLKGGIDGGKGDPYEQHADAVADKVVRGESAESLLDTMGPTKTGASSSASVQRKEDAKPPTPGKLRLMLGVYLNRHMSKVWAAVNEHNQAAYFPNPDKRLTWGNQRMFVNRLKSQLETNIEFLKIAQLDEILYPSDTVRTVGALLPTSKEYWSPEIGIAIAHALHIGIVASLQRLGPRYVTVADSLGVDELLDPRLVTTSTPLDRYVAPAMCMAHVLKVTALDAKDAKAAKGKSVDLRDVKLTWQTGDIWNWVKAEPADATAEEVAAKLWVVTDQHGDRNASFNAYLLAAAPPLFGVPTRFAIQNQIAKQNAPKHAVTEDDSTDKQLLQLASSSAADESALAEKAPAAAGPKPPPVPAYAKIETALFDCTLQLDHAIKRVTPWGLRNHLTPALTFLKRKGAELLTVDPKHHADWLAVLDGQKGRLVNITGAIEALVTSATKLGITDPLGPKAGPAREILEQFALAAGLSHLPQPAEAKLALGLRLQSTLSVRALQSTEGDMMGAISEVHGQAGDNKHTSELSSQAVDLQQQSRELQSKMLNGVEVDPDAYDDVTMKSDEVALESRLYGTEVGLGHLNNAADAAGKGDAAIIASIFSGKFRGLKSVTTHIFHELEPIRNNWNSGRKGFQEEEKSSSVARKRQNRGDRHKILAEAQTRFDKIKFDHDLVHFFQEASETIQNQQFRTAIVQVAAMIGVSLVGGAVAGLAARAVGGILLETTGAAAMADLSMVARTGIQAAKMATQIGVDTTINAAGTAAIQGRDFTEVWKENLIVALASTAVFGSINRYAAQAAQREAELAQLEGRVVEQAKTWATVGKAGKALMVGKEVGAITVHTIWGAAMGSVAGRIVTGKTQPSPETLREWALQGISVAIGRHVQERLTTHSEMYKALEQRAESGGRALVIESRKLAALAKEVISSKEPHRAVDLLAEHDAFLRKAIQEVDRAIAKGGDHNGVLTEERSNLVASADAAGSDGMVETKMVLIGMEELIPGALWKGTEKQINEAITAAKGKDGNGKVGVTHENGRWRIRVGEREIEIQQVRSTEKTVDVERVLLAGDDGGVRLAAKLVPPEAGYLDVVVHGDVDGFMVTVNGKDIEITHRALAKHIEKSGIPYEKIRLLACKAGTHPKGAAQQLANKLGVPVLAPTDTLFIHPDGHMTVGPTETRDLGAKGWQEFKPQKSESRSQFAPEPEPQTATEKWKAANEEKKSGAKRLGGPDHDSDVATPSEPRSVKVNDPAKAKWVSDLKGKLSPEEGHQLDLVSKGKDAGEVHDMFRGDIAVAKAKLSGSNLTPELYQRRAGLSAKAQRAFDNKWNLMIGNERNPSVAKLKAFEGYLDAIEKRAGDLIKGLEAEEAKIPASKVVSEPKSSAFPPSWQKFNPAHNAEFKIKLEEFRGTDVMEQNFVGGEGAVYLGDSKTTAIKRWFAKRIGDMAESLSKLRNARVAVTGNPDLSRHIDVVAIHETSTDWIVRDFVTGSEELKNFTTGHAETARTEAIKALEAKPTRSATEENILGKLRGKSANLHWDPARGKIVVIDMQ